MTTFDEWYAIYQADPATDGLAPTPRAAYEAGARSRDSLLNDVLRVLRMYGENESGLANDIRAALKETK